MVNRYRPGRDEYFIAMAHLVALRGTCSRRSVGCVLVNGYNHVLATGYNGPPRGFSHCIDKPCAGASLPSGSGLDVCQAIHAEQNALLQCKDVMSITTAYVTTAPCVTCTKLLLNTSCSRICYSQDYPHSHESDSLWTQGGRSWEYIHHEALLV